MALSTSSRIAWNTTTSWLSSLISGILALFLVRFLLHRIGTDGYGLMALITAMVGFGLMSDLGLRRALNRHLAEQIALDDSQRVNELFSSALIVYVLMSVLPVAACVVFAQPLVSFLKIPPEIEPAAVFLVRYYASATILLSFVAPAYEAVLFSTNRYYIWDFTHIAEVVLRTVAILLLVGLTKAGLYGWAAAGFGAQFFGFLLNRFYAHRVWPQLRVHAQYIRRDAIGKLFSLGGLLFLNQMVHTLSRRADPMILSPLLGPGAVGFYQPSVQVLTSAQPFVTAVSRQLPPLATGYHATGRTAELQEILVQGTRYTFLMGIPVCVILGCFTYPLVNVWLGPGFEPTAWAMVLWAVVDLCDYAGGGQWSVLLGMDRIKLVVGLRLALAIVNLLASIALVWWMASANWGMVAIIGVVIPTAILGILFRVIMTIYAGRATGLGGWHYFQRAFAWPLVILVILALVSLMLTVWVRPASWMGLIGCAAVPAVLWAPLCWCVALDAKDRSRFGSLAKGLWVRLRIGSGDSGHDASPTSPTH